jgi:hypothetical protein
VLVGVDDVETGVGEEAADRGDQPRPVRAGEEQTGCRLVGDPSMMAVRRPSSAERRLRKIEFSGQVADATSCLTLWRTAPGM